MDMGKSGFGYSHTLENVTFNSVLQPMQITLRMVTRKTKQIITTVDTDLEMEDLYLHVQLLQSEARAAVEAGLEMGNGEEEEDRPGLDARTRLPPVLQAPKTPMSVTSDPNGPSICAHRHHPLP
jgi:hypothetical protein